MAETFRDIFGHRLYFSADHRRHALKEHPEVRSYLKYISDTLRQPAFVKQSPRDAGVYLYYRFYPDIFNGKYLLVVARVRHQATVLTCYITDYVKLGAMLWPKT